MKAPITTEEREAWLDAAERELAAMRAFANQLEQRWARLLAMAGEARKGIEQ